MAYIRFDWTNTSYSHSVLPVIGTEVTERIFVRLSILAIVRNLWKAHLTFIHPFLFACQHQSLASHYWLSFIGRHWIDGGTHASLTSRNWLAIPQHVLSLYIRGLSSRLVNRVLPAAILTLYTVGILRRGLHLIIVFFIEIHECLPSSKKIKMGGPAFLVFLLKGIIHLLAGCVTFHW